MARATTAIDRQSDIRIPGEVHTLDSCPFSFAKPHIAPTTEPDMSLMLCAWCASRGSGTPELDDAAYVVMVLLRAMGVFAVGVRWSDDVAEFLVRVADDVVSRRASIVGLIDTDHAELARSLARRHVWTQT